MPTYEITAPDGNVYEVTAPEGASEQEVLSYAQQNYSSLSPKEQQMQTDNQPPMYGGGGVANLRAGLAGAADMATLGFADEIKGSIQGQIRGALDPNVTRQEATEYFINKARSDAERLKQENPKSYFGGQVAGALVPYGGAARGGMTVARGAGIGALQGGLYGAGSGEGAPEERIEEAAMGGAFGAVGGTGGVLAGRQLGRLAQSKPVKSLSERAKALYSKPVQQNIAKEISENVGADVDLRKLSKSGDDIFSMTKGQKTQMPKPQRLEADALAGTYGDDAERAIRQAQIAQSRERQGFISQLGDIEKAGDASDILDNVFGTIKKQSKNLKGQVDNAYALAREGGGTRISTDDIKDGLFSTVAAIKKEGQYDLGQMPQATARVKDLSKLVRKSGGGRFKEASLSAMENWRKRVTNSIASTQDKTEKRFLGQMLSQYDDFMYKTANEAVDQNDANAIMAFRDAVSKRREYGKLYESDKFIKDLVEGNKGLDDAVKDLIGTGSIVGKKRMEGTYDAIIKAAGDESNLVRADLQAAFAKKLLDQSITGLEAGGERAYLSAAKTKKALEGLFVNNKNFAKKLYGENAVNAARQAIDELEKISSTQAATQNPSGTGQMVLRNIMRLPFIQTLKEGVNFAVVKPMRTGQVAKSVDPVVSQIQSIQITPQSSLFAGAGGRLMAEQGASE